MISDKDLLFILSTNKNKGMNILIDEYSALVYTIISNHLESSLSNEDIEECVSNVFIDVFKNIDKLNINNGTIKGFLSIVAKRRAIDMYRKYSKKNNLVVSYDSLYEEPFGEFNDISSHLRDKELSSLILNSINELNEIDKIIIIKKYFLKESSKDISLSLNIKVNTIDKRASRALSKLKSKLGGFIYE
ncbi:MAG: sigma-70 family RNA polymerase sigma factor [Clostridium sp.]